MDWDDGAPTTRLEVVTIYRPTRVVAAVCCFIVTLLMIISICPADWADTMETSDSLYRQREGLFRICTVSSLKGVTLPPQITEKGCVVQHRDFMKGIAALIIIGWILTLAAGCLMSYGMLSQRDQLKTIVYKVSFILLVITGVMLLIALITFPVMVAKQLKSSITASVWSIGWAYMLDWAALIILVLTIVLLAIDRNPDETSVREKVTRSRF